MSYRDDFEALKQRHQQLARDLDELRSQQRDLADTSERIDEVQDELRRVRERLDQRQTKRGLPVLDDVAIASPCKERWQDMVGDERVRFCGKCDKNVYNVVAMTRHDAERLIEEHEGRVCLRLYRRRDGTVLTSDCPVGIRRKRVTRIAAAALALGGAGLAITALQAESASCLSGATPIVDVDPGASTVAPEMGEVDMGDVAVAPPVMGGIGPIPPLGVDRPK